MESNVKVEIIYMANAYLEVHTWTDNDGHSHSHIARTVSYTDVAGAEATEIENKIEKLNRYEVVQPTAHGRRKW
jgi:hypothetical protein